MFSPDFVPGGSTPNEFSTTITFDIPYVYTGGDLLIEIRSESPAQQLLIDSTSATAGQSLFSDFAGAGGTGNADATTSNTGVLNVNWALNLQVGSSPGNDNWLNTIGLGNIGAGETLNRVGNNVFATTQESEQQLQNTGSTVWWFFTAGESGTVTVDTFGSSYDTQLHIFDGFFPGINFADLNFVVGNDDTGGLQSQVTFEVTAGECYEIRVGGFRVSGSMGSGSEGCINLNVTFEESFVLGDVNCDGLVNLLDVDPFIDLISTGEFNPKADINGDDNVNLLDVDPFIELLAGG